MDYVWLGVAGFFAWLLSTVAGGGAALLLVPVINYTAGARAVPPVDTLGTLLGGGSRIVVFWQNVQWRIVKWYLPGAVVGGVLGAAVFANSPIEWVQIILGVVLLISAWQFMGGEREHTFKMKTWYFLPVGFGVAFLSGLAGATGEILTPFYLNEGVVKEQMIATKSVNSFAMHLAKIGTYVALGAMTWQYVGYGAVIGVVAALASVAGKRLLGEMKNVWFRRLAIGIMAISGVVLLWDQRETLLALIGQ